MDTPDSQSTDDASFENTKVWASNAGYPITRKKKFVGLSPMRTPLRPAQGPRIPVQAAPISQLNVAGLAITRPLKGGDTKKVCEVDIAGTKYVLKGATGTPAAHVAATDLIGKMGMKGVRTPATRVLTAQEKAGLIATLSQGGHDAREMASALNLGTGQISEMSTGRGLDKIVLREDFPPAIKNADAFRKTLLDKTQDEAWKAAFEEMVAKTPKGNLLLLNTELKNWVATTDPATRKIALQWMEDNLSRPLHVSMLKVLKDVDADQVQAGIDRAATEETERADAKKKLTEFAESDEGIEAFAGVVAGDIVAGMYDRMVGDWNGGNFMFDGAKKELVCVDNAKIPETAPGQADPSYWKAFFLKYAGSAKPLDETIFDRIYGKNDGGPDKPGNYVDFTPAKKANAKEIIRGVLATLVTKVESSADFDPQVQDRVAMLKGKVILDDAFRLPAHLAKPPALPAKIETTDKLGRMGKSFFTANKKDKRLDTDQIKKALRAGTITAADARTQLEALQAQAKSLGTDRRSSKINYLASAMEFCERLKSGAKTLNAYLKTKPPAELWSDDAAKALIAPLQEAVPLWQASAVKDAKIADQIDTAWAEFMHEVKAA